LEETVRTSFYNACLGPGYFLTKTAADAAVPPAGLDPSAC